MMVRLTQEAETSQSGIKKKIRQFWQWYLAYIEDLISRAQAAEQISIKPSAHQRAQQVIRLWTGTVALEGVEPFRTQWDQLPEQVIRSIGG